MARKRNKPKPMSLEDQARRLKDPAFRGKIGAAAADAEEARLKAEKVRVYASVPSAAWGDAVWNQGEPFPPGGSRTLMRPCRGCAARGTPTLYPPTYLVNGLCCECVHDSMSDAELHQLPSSRPVQYGRLRGKGMRQLVRRHGMDVQGVAAPP